MKISTIVDKIRLEKKEFVTSDELEKYCKAFKIDHRAAIHYLTKMRYLVRIFRGIFYVRTLKEFKLGMTTRYNHLTILMTIENFASLTSCAQDTCRCQP